MAGEVIPDMLRADSAETRKREDDQDTHDRLVEEAHNQPTDLQATDLETLKRKAEERVEKVTAAMPKADRST